MTPRRKMITTGALWSEKLAAMDHASERLYWRIHMASDNYGVLAGKAWDVCQKAVPGVGSFNVRAVEKSITSLVAIGLLEHWSEPDGSEWVYVIGHDDHQTPDFLRKRGKRLTPKPPSLRSDTQRHIIGVEVHEPSADAEGCPSLPLSAVGATFSASITSTKGKEEKRSLSSSARPKRDIEAEARQVFDHWVKVWNKRSNTIFEGERKTKTIARLRSGYTVSQLCEAVSGYRLSENHNGSKGKVYDDLELFMRDAVKVDAGIAYGSTAVNRAAAATSPNTVDAAVLYEVEQLIGRELTSAEDEGLQTGAISVTEFVATHRKVSA